MKTRVLWTERARRDLLEIGDFIGRDKPEAAPRCATKLIEAVERTALFPTSGRIAPEVDRHDIREVILGIYSIVHHLDKDPIMILAIFERHQLINESSVERADST
jgi:plasmid stabilization system protein ParE